MVPSWTWRAPIQSTKMMVPITAVMINAVSAARTRVRLIAVTKLVSVRAAKRRASCCLLRIGLHRRHGVEDFARQGRGVGDPVLGFARELLDLAADGEDGQRQQGHQAQIEGEQIEAGDGQHDHAADELEQAAQAHRNGTADHGLDQRRVAGQPRQHFARSAGSRRIAATATIRAHRRRCAGRPSPARLPTTQCNSAPPRRAPRCTPCRTGR